ncbi:MAG: hypothetical protein M0030_11495 [Actinomycetota bacterium]|nr:hypothetical protein [Actinomycetota bacterium]
MADTPDTTTTAAHPAAGCAREGCGHGPGTPFPGRPSCLTGFCGHAVAGSEWRAGFRTCERCTGPRDLPVTPAYPGWGCEILFAASCPNPLCQTDSPHAHPVCPDCGSVSYGNPACPGCRDQRRHARDGDLARVIAPEPEYVTTWRERWLPVVTNDDGTLRIDQLARELADYRDLMDRAHEVYMAVTGERIGKVTTKPGPIIEIVNERIDQAGQDALTGFLTDDDQAAITGARDLLDAWEDDRYVSGRAAITCVRDLLAVLGRLPAASAEDSPGD